MKFYVNNLLTQDHFKTPTRTNVLLLNEENMCPKLAASVFVNPNSHVDLQCPRDTLHSLDAQFLYQKNELFSPEKGQIVITTIVKIRTNRTILSLNSKIRKRKKKKNNNNKIRKYLVVSVYHQYSQ